MTYYERANVVHLDGTRIFNKPADQEAARDVANLIEQAWNCELHPFGALSPIDWYAQRFGRLIGLLEVKARSHAINTYPTVYLNVRKWLALSLGSVGLGVPAIFAVRFTDCVTWTPVARIDATQTVIAGCARLVKSHNDIEPVIEVPIGNLRTLVRL